MQTYVNESVLKTHDYTNQKNKQVGNYDFIQNNCQNVKKKKLLEN